MANKNLEGYRLYFKKQGVDGINWQTLPYVNTDFCHDPPQISFINSEYATQIMVCTYSYTFELYTNGEQFHNPSSYWTFTEDDTHYLGTLLTKSWVMQDEASITLINSPLLNSTDNMYLEVPN